MDDNQCGASSISKRWHDLGQFYREMKLSDKAIKSFLKSCRSSITPNKFSANSLATLGFMYWKGEGVEQNEYLAKDFFERASEQGHYGAMTKLGVLFLEKEEEESTILTIEWLERGSLNGCERAPWYLGMLNFYGFQGMPPDYQKAFDWLKLSCSRGNTELGSLGHMYLEGLGTEKNTEEAIKCFTISANFGDIDSMHTLGNLFLKPPNEDVTKDVSRAVYWYTKALQKGSRNTWNLARIYFEGNHVSADHCLALDLFLIGANDSCRSSMFQVSLMYFNGYGEVQQNVTKAIFWLEKFISANQDLLTYWESRANQGGQNANGIQIAAGRNGTFIPEFQDERRSVGFEEYEENARIYEINEDDEEREEEEDIARGIRRLGMAMCLLGEAFEMKNPPDYISMMKWFKKSSELNCKEGSYNLAFRYLHGTPNHVARDVDKAIMYYKKAAGLGSTGAMTNMGYIFEHVIGDFNQAMEWYSIAANNDNITAALILALKYENGSNFLKKNVHESKAWYRLIETRSSSKDLYYIGKDFLTGIPGSIEVNLEKARFFFKLCSNKVISRRRRSGRPESLGRGRRRRRWEVKIKKMMKKLSQREVCEKMAGFKMRTYADVMVVCRFV